MTTAAQDEYNELFRDKSRRTRHRDDDEEEDQDSAHSSDLENTASPSDSPVPETARRDNIPKYKSYSNTGPKGVIADAQAFEAARREQLRNARNPYFEYPGVPEVASPNLDSKSNKSGSSDTDSEGEGFMAQWRQSRLRELCSGGNSNSNKKSPSREGRGGGSGRAYGGLVSVDGEGYLDAVERSPANTVVVVFIYDDQSDVSFLVEDCVRALARRHKATRFVKLHYLEAEMEPAGVPAVLAYRGGDKFAGLVPVVDEIPDDADLSVVSLENLFQKHQIL